MLEQVRGSDVECRVALPEALVGESGSEVGLAAAAGANQYQPPLGFTGKGFSCLMGSGKSLLVSRVTTSSLRY